MANWKFPSQYRPITSLAADVDGDGKKDLVLASDAGTNGSLSVYYNHDLFVGNSNNTIFTSMGGLNRTVAGDFDGDGQTEIAVEVTGGIQLLNANTSAVEGFKPIAGTINSFTSGYLAGTSSPDIVVATSTTIYIFAGGVSFYQNADPSYSIDSTSGSITSLSLANITGNGERDLLVGYSNYGWQVLYNALVPPFFSLSNSLNISTGTGDPIVIGSSDLNMADEGSGPHQNDVAVVNTQTNDVKCTCTVRALPTSHQPRNSS